MTKVNLLQSEMQSLRVDNDRLNQLVKRGHINNEAAVKTTESKSELSDQKLPSELEDLTFRANSLGMAGAHYHILI